MGTQQSGVLNLQIADIVRDRDILALAREKTIKILTDDALQKPEHATLRAVYIELTKRKISGTTSVNFFIKLFFFLKLN
jgi:ATP-dependent DNA helicase RecG